MPESPLYGKPLIKSADVAIEDLMGIAHPRGGMSDDCAITVMSLAEAMGIGCIAHNTAALVARHVPVPHQQKNVGNFVLPPLPAPTGQTPALFQAAARARANALKAEANKHSLSVGTREAEGAHKVAGSPILTADATDFATTITMTKLVIAWLRAHSVQSGVHFHDDPLGAAYMPPFTNPLTLAEVTADLNHVTPAIQQHVAYGVA